MRMGKLLGVCMIVLAVLTPLSSGDTINEAIGEAINDAIRRLPPPDTERMRALGITTVDFDATRFQGSTFFDAAYLLVPRGRTSGAAMISGTHTVSSDSSGNLIIDGYTIEIGGASVLGTGFMISRASNPLGADGAPALTSFSTMIGGQEGTRARFAADSHLCVGRCMDQDRDTEGENDRWNTVRIRDGQIEVLAREGNMFIHLDRDPQGHPPLIFRISPGAYVEVTYPGGQISSTDSGAAYIRRPINGITMINAQTGVEITPDSGILSLGGGRQVGRIIASVSGGDPFSDPSSEPMK